MPIKLASPSKFHLHRRIFDQLKIKGLFAYGFNPLEIDQKILKKEDFPEILFSNGWVNHIDYYQALSEVLNMQMFYPKEEYIQFDLIDPNLYDNYKDFSFAPVSASSGITNIITTNVNNKLIQRLDSLYQSYRLMLVTPHDLSWLLRQRFKEKQLHDSSNLLADKNPRASAKTLSSRFIGICVAIVLLSLLFIFEPLTSIFIGVGIFLLCHLLKLYLIYISMTYSYEFDMDQSQLEFIKDEDLPDYSIIVALYKESEVISQLFSSLHSLDYPKEKLDVKIVLEEDDQETLEAINSVGTPQYMDIIIVPSGPTDINIVKTKARACNYALSYCKGEFVALFDAEDVPDKLQLRKSLQYLLNERLNLACVQARLHFYNSNQNLLTRLFDMEYRIWFKLLLPGLHILEAPIPLGGTSNHFNKSILENIGGWDAYNVTEDADLGIRLHAQGYKVGLIDSDTPEECPSSVRAWINQRSRWIKGHLITFFVHYRNSFNLLNTIGTRGFVVLTLFILFPLLSFLIYPFFWGIFFLDYFDVEVINGANIIPSAYKDLLMFGLIFPNFIYISIGIIISIKDRKYEDIIFSFLQPIYWLLHSIAAYIAIFDTIRRPYHWNKTQHGINRYDSQTDS